MPSWIPAVIGGGATLASALLNRGGSRDVQQTEVKYPSFVRNMSEDIVDRGRDLADQPYTRYPGSRIADWNPVQGQVYDATQDAAGNWIPMVQRAGGAVDQAMRISKPNKFKYRPVKVYSGQDVVPEDVTPMMWDADQAGRYMNPYIKEALDPAVRDAQIAFTRDILGDRASAAAEGAFGGSRQAILDQENRRRFETGIGDMLARGYAGAYESGLGAFARDADRKLMADVGNVERVTGAAFQNLRNKYDQSVFNRGARERAWQMGEDSRWNSVRSLLSGGQFYGNLGRMTSDLTRADLASLWNVGSQEQLLRQMRADQDYDDWLEARDWGERGLRYMGDALGLTPYGRGPSTTTVSGPGRNRWAEALGTGLTAWSLARDYGQPSPQTTDWAALHADPYPGRSVR